MLRIFLLLSVLVLGAWTRHFQKLQLDVNRRTNSFEVRVRGKELWFCKWIGPSKTDGSGLNAE